MISRMLEIKDIEKLATLARIDIPEEEKEGLVGEISSILSYVEQIQKISGTNADASQEKPPLKNVFREDTNPHLSNEFTADLLEEVPRKQDGYVKVKKIL